MQNSWIVRLGGASLAVFILGILAVFLGACANSVTDRDVDKHMVSVGEVRRLIDLQQRKNRDDIILLVDPRPESEFAKGHLPGARNVQLSVIKLKGPVDKSIDRYKNIIVYGNDPSSAAARGMTKRLMGTGYDNVAYYAGGIYQWTATGGELETSKTTRDTDKTAPVGAAGIMAGP
jgi:rhodanese-related sulfurtransferase